MNVVDWSRIRAKVHRDYRKAIFNHLKQYGFAPDGGGYVAARGEDWAQGCCVYKFGVVRDERVELRVEFHAGHRAAGGFDGTSKDYRQPFWQYVDLQDFGEPGFRNFRMELGVDDFSALLQHDIDLIESKVVPFLLAGRDPSTAADAWFRGWDHKPHDLYKALRIRRYYGQDCARLLLDAIATMPDPSIKDPSIYAHDCTVLSGYCAEYGVEVPGRLRGWVRDIHDKLQRDPAYRARLSEDDIPGIEALVLGFDAQGD